MAVPAVIITGPLLGKVLKKIRTTTNNLFTAVSMEKKKLPAVFPSFPIALLPVLLITLAVVAAYIIPNDNGFKKAILFVGDATIALLATVVIAIWYLGLRSGHTMPTVMQWRNSPVSGIAMILLITTAGGVLKQVLPDSDTGAYIPSFSSQRRMSPLIFTWIVTALLRVSIGSVAVAGITAAHCRR